MKHVISTAALLLLGACQAESVAPVPQHDAIAATGSGKRDTIIETAHTVDISQPCAVYFSPSVSDLDSLKKEVGEEDFSVIMDDNMWYTSESYTFFSTKGIPTLEAEERTVRFHLDNGSIRTFSAASADVKGNIVLFDGKRSLSVVSPIDAEQAFGKLFR